MSTRNTDIERTMGDGMDNSHLHVPENFGPNLIKVNLKPTLKMLKSLKPIEPKHKVHLIPKYIPKEKVKVKYLTTKPKEPKFVPYEPYKAAIDPIVPKARHSGPKVSSADTSRNNIEIQTLVMQLSDIRTSELKRTSQESDRSDVLISRHEWEKEKETYLNDIKNLKESNNILESQLKLQTQVNSELKTLLVAAVGEDLESRVQHLTEDKLHLARALLKSANHLTSHQEQMEWLSGQCEVWRSKFLASSLMVEELARWKSALSIRVNDLQSTIRSLLNESSKIQKTLIKTNTNLRTSIKNSLGDEEFNQKYPIPKSADVHHLSTNNMFLSSFFTNVFQQSADKSNNIFVELTKLPQHSPTEVAASKILKSHVNISNKQEALCNALMGAAVNLRNEQTMLQQPIAHATCCSHCTGKIEDI